MKATITLSPAAEAALVVEHAIALGTRLLTVPEFALRTQGGDSKHACRLVNASIRNGTIPARLVGKTWCIHMPTYVAAQRKGAASDPR